MVIKLLSEDIDFEVFETLSEEKLTKEKRDALKDSDFGIPKLRKFPLIDEHHVKNAMRFFGKAPKEHRKTLAKNIKKRCSDLGINYSKDDKWVKALEDVEIPTLADMPETDYVIDVDNSYVNYSEYDDAEAAVAIAMAEQATMMYNQMMYLYESVCNIDTYRLVAEGVGGAVSAIFNTFMKVLHWLWKIIGGILKFFGIIKTSSGGGGGGSYVPPDEKEHMKESLSRFESKLNDMSSDLKTKVSGIPVTPEVKEELKRKTLSPETPFNYIRKIEQSLSKNASTTIDNIALKVLTNQNVDVVRNSDKEHIMFQPKNFKGWVVVPQVMFELQSYLIGAGEKYLESDALKLTVKGLLDEIDVINRSNLGDNIKGLPMKVVLNDDDTWKKMSFTYDKVKLYISAIYEVMVKYNAGNELGFSVNISDKDAFTMSLDEIKINDVLLGKVRAFNQIDDGKSRLDKFIAGFLNAGTVDEYLRLRDNIKGYDPETMSSVISEKKGIFGASDLTSEDQKYLKILTETVINLTGFVAYFLGIYGAICLTAEYNYDKLLLATLKIANIIDEV